MSVLTPSRRALIQALADAERQRELCRGLIGDRSIGRRMKERVDRLTQQRDYLLRELGWNDGDSRTR